MKNYGKAKKTEIPCIKCKFSRETSYAKEVKVKRIRCRYLGIDSKVGARMTCDYATLSNKER
jgi:hypothetical protein